MTQEEAWLYAATWGSYMHNGDPGACMYGFDESFEPQNEAHRRACIRWIKERCIPYVLRDPHLFEPDELDNLEKLLNLLREPEVSA